MANVWDIYKPQLEESKAARKKLLEEYNAYASLQPTFFQRLLDEIKATGNYPIESNIERSLAAINPPQGVVMNPGVYENLASKMGSARRATIADLMGRAQGGLESDIAARGGAYTQANQAYQDLLSEYGLANTQEQQALAQRNWEQEFGLRQAQIANTRAKEIRNQPGGETWNTNYERYKTSILGGMIDKEELMSSGAIPQDIRTYLANDPDVVNYYNKIADIDALRDIVSTKYTDLEKKYPNAIANPKKMTKFKKGINDLSGEVFNLGYKPTDFGLPAYDLPTYKPTLSEYFKQYSEYPKHFGESLLGKFLGKFF